ncbi:hypothetical protein HanOQP8_Chr16g0627251 [Helianthus annuus]|nr:hypothetical protein HanHA89_Chr16g0672241 [Helianthus annuus]KAJ0641863.1 hypothetical protein HanLR1_Chr16g0631901 [Helianthus annuus]KAJ0645740.1 hypothetical protein HanOQP8_Chr16g0627251 [Helianthus annuus]KAJ0822283.1 hypothetical protein HanPSC8_Chr16g0730181 [Helianthus annuus]
MMANGKTLNKKYWFKFPRFLQMILEAMYSQLQPTVSIYDTKIMNHFVFSILNQERTDVQVTYQNMKPFVKFGAFPEIVEQVQAPVNAVVADEHDVQIIDAPPRSSEPIEYIDLTRVESEEDNVFNGRMMDDAELDTELDANVDDIETKINTESLTAEEPIEDQPSSVNPPRTEPVKTVSAEPESVTEDPTADLHPRKRRRRDPRISREIDAETRSNL